MLLDATRDVGNKIYIPDIAIGTCCYGAPLHYGYYKNTATHNKVCINGDNMPVGKLIYLKLV